MQDFTAKINGVALTEAQLQDGLAQIATQRMARTNKTITVAANNCGNGYISIPPAVMWEMIEAFKAHDERHYVTLRGDGTVNWNTIDGAAKYHPALKGFR